MAARTGRHYLFIETVEYGLDLPNAMDSAATQNALAAAVLPTRVHDFEPHHNRTTLWSALAVVL